MKILLLDNYDSFTYNLLHLLEQFEGADTAVFRNDEIELDQVSDFDKIVLSPGPGLPEEAGIMMGLIHEFAASKSILGVCLGHQAVAQAFGATLFNLNQVQHGVSTVTTIIDHSEKIFYTIPRTFRTGRYHSWMVDRKQLPDCLQITAVDEQQRIMAIRHSTVDVCGVQFHPESILSDYGKLLIGNWLRD
jgi:anthranilate synthase component 2